MSPAEALYETSRGPTRSMAFMGRRLDLAETTERLTEDLDETSNCPIPLDVVRSPERRPAAPLEGPGRDRQEPSKSPASSKTGAGPGRDRRKTVARPGSDPRRSAQRHLVWSWVVSGLLSIPSARGTSRTWPQGSVSCPCGAASGAWAFRARAGCPRSGPQRAPEGPRGPRTISRNEKLSYGAMTFHVSGCQRLQQQGAGAQLLEGIPRHGMSRFVDGRGRGAGGVPGLRRSAAERSREGSIGVRSLYRNESEEPS